MKEKKGSKCSSRHKCIKKDCIHANNQLGIDAEQVALQLLGVIKGFKKRGMNELEIPDFANELGIIMGKEIRDHKSLLSGFRMGFEHGVELVAEHK
ncbi:hypothetical protein P7F88_03910 [Vibrio hannami]|uniref:hypothetical protein n=1 Tax=Vibrio hannami TaxID=2717094 RepID=UPI00240F9E0D|nr:hypothetical protein [Vibrio hannami]MDG3085293.1 hypothetical protein [Vibrio hannami]